MNIKPMMKPTSQTNFETFTVPADAKVPRAVGINFDWTNFDIDKILIWIDWRDEGAVTPVRDQGHCGSSYAIAATGALEGQFFTQYRELTELSIQNILDCSSSFGNLGCDGGLIEGSYKYIISTGGIDSEKAYPYEAQTGKCRFNGTAVVANCSVKKSFLLFNHLFDWDLSSFSVIIISTSEMKMLLRMR